MSGEARSRAGGGALTAALLLLFLGLRSYNLTLLPIFRDECSHLSWSLRLLRESGFLKPLADGKFLQVLVLALVVPGSSDPLWTGRLASVFVGALGMWSCGEIGRRLFGARVGLLAAVLYLVCPFTLFYDRMALADVYLSSFAALTLLGSLALLEEPTPGRGVRLGLAMTACVLSKVPGLLTLGVPALAALVLGPRTARVWRSLAIAYGLALVLLVLPVGYFFIHTTQIQAKAVSAEESPEAPGQIVTENVGLGLSWLWAYWTPPLLLAGVAETLLGLARRERAALLLALCALAPPAAFALFAVYWFPRYILFATVPFLVLSARFLDRTAGLAAGGRLARAGATAGVALLASLPAFRFDAALLRDPAHAPLPPEERYQYVDGWPSGYGTADAVDLLRRELAAHPDGIAVVAAPLGHPTPYVALRACFLNEPRVSVARLDLWDPETHATVAQLARSRPAFLVVTWSKPARMLPLPESREFVASRLAFLSKPNGVRMGEVYRVLPAEQGARPDPSQERN